MATRSSLILSLLLVLFFPFVSTAQPQPIDAEGHRWWQHAVFYEIYPRSFADSNNNGIGDLNGISSKMSYLHELGVDAIWITPFYPSPQVDFGYDVSDYRNIDPMYGTLTGMSGVTAKRPASLRITGSQSSAARRGRSISPPISTTIISSTRNSQT